MELDYVFGFIELELQVGIAVEAYEILHLLVGHDDGNITAAHLWLDLELEQGVVFLLQLAHTKFCGLYEEEIANDGTLSDLACAILLTHHALIPLHGQEGGYIDLIGQCFDNLLLPAIGGTHRIPLSDVCICHLDDYFGVHINKKGVPLAPYTLLQVTIIQAFTSF